MSKFTILLVTAAVAAVVLVSCGPQPSQGAPASYDRSNPPNFQATNHKPYQIPADRHGVRREWHGHWYAYGRGPCWVKTPNGFLWVCEPGDKTGDK